MLFSPCHTGRQIHKFIGAIQAKRLVHQDAIIQSLRSRLSRQKASELKIEAISTGIQTSGTKAEVIDRLVSHYNQIIPLEVTASYGYIVPKSVISIDVGYRNLAFAHVSADNQVLRWHRVDLDIDNHHPSHSAVSVTRFVRQQLLTDMKNDCAVVIERQRFRSMGGHSVLEHTLRVNMVEAMLWSALQCMTGTDMTKEAVNAIAVEKYWSMIQPEFSTLSEAESKTTSRSKKKRSQDLVTHWLETDVLNCSSELRAMFAAEKKKDDLSDSLLQGIAWLNWRKHIYKRILDTL
ncbi:ribonuclease H-like domain-containing protein [Umbelopsis sp. PMI_123]|nr:ribonuclease H-like domain-containing protein [Umbelopsis sp. PMI_123]